MTDECPNCNKSIIDNDNVILNIFNISNPDYKLQQKYCNEKCIIEKSEKIKSGINFGPISLENPILFLAKAKNGEYCIIVDLF